MSELAKRPGPGVDVHRSFYLFCRETCSPLGAWRDFTKVFFFALLLVVLFAGPVALLRLVSEPAGGPSLAETQQSVCEMSGQFCGGSITGSIPQR